MAHAQKPDFVFRRNGRLQFKSAGASVRSTAGSRRVLISGSNAGYTVFRGSVKGTGYPLPSPVSPSIPLPCVAVCHHISTGVYDLVEVVTFLHFNQLYGTILFRAFWIVSITTCLQEKIILLVTVLVTRHPLPLGLFCVHTMPPPPQRNKGDCSCD